MMRQSYKNGTIAWGYDRAAGLFLQQATANTMEEDDMVINRDQALLGSTASTKVLEAFWRKNFLFRSDILRFFEENCPEAIPAYEAFEKSPLPEEYRGFMFEADRLRHDRGRDLKTNGDLQKFIEDAKGRYICVTTWGDEMIYGDYDNGGHATLLIPEKGLYQ